MVEQKLIRTPRIKVVTTSGTVEGDITMVYPNDLEQGTLGYWFKLHHSKEEFFSMSGKKGEIMIRVSEIVYIEELDEGNEREFKLSNSVPILD